MPSPEERFREGESHRLGRAGQVNLGVAAACYREAADAGHPKARFRLGECVLWGLGAPQGLEEAQRLFTVASADLRELAEAGDAEARLMLGLIASGRRGVAIDVEEAERWLTAAAGDDGYVAMIELARLYSHHKPEPLCERLAKALPAALETALQAPDPDLIKALRTQCTDLTDVQIDRLGALLERGAAMGDPALQYDLALRFASDEDAGQALAWLARARAQGYAPAFTSLVFEVLGVEPQQPVWGYDALVSRGDPAACSDQVMHESLHELPADTPEAYRQSIARQVVLYRHGARWGSTLCMVMVASIEQSDSRPYEPAPHGLVSTEEAIGWLELAIRLNDTLAMVDLGERYLAGEGVERDAGRAAALFARAAAHEDEKAELLLGKCYLEGVGVPRDEALALGCFSRAPHRKEALLHLGRMYRDGVGTPVDLDRSIATLEQVLVPGPFGFIARADADQARFELSRALLAHPDLERQATGFELTFEIEDPELLERTGGFCDAWLERLVPKVAEGDAAARKAFERCSLASIKAPGKLGSLVEAAEGGDLWSRYWLAHLASEHPEGLGVPPETIRAYLTIAAEADPTAFPSAPRARTKLGRLWQDGQHGPADEEAAFRWFLSAATAGEDEAYMHLAEAYAKGRGVARDLDLAVYWARKMAADGTMTGEVLLSDYLLESAPEEALAWAKRAARNPGAEAIPMIQAEMCRLVGARYETGIGTPVDRATALAWYREAAELGNDDARVWVGSLWRRLSWWFLDRIGR